MASLKFRRANERGDANHGWLHSRHTFSFANYFDPKWQGFRNLLVINDDRVDAGEGFPTHGHRDMEIVSYVLEGALEHKDSMGTGSVIRPGDVQRMSAGTGVRHSEYNASKTDPVHFLQIWIQPKERSISPGYEQKSFSEDEAVISTNGSFSFSDADKPGRLRARASPPARDGSITIPADAEIHAGIFEDGQRATYEPKSGRSTWIHVASGSVKVGGEKLVEGDAAYATDADAITIEGDGRGEILLFDLA